MTFCCIWARWRRFLWLIAGNLGDDPGVFRGISDLIHGSTPTRCLPGAWRMILLVIVGTLPLFAILGIKDWIESLSSNLYVVGGALIVTGCLLFASDRVRKGRKNEHSARMTDALIVGARRRWLPVRDCPAPVRRSPWAASLALSGSLRSAIPSSCRSLLY